MVSVDIKTVSEDILPDPSRLTFRPHHADDPRQNDAAWEVFAGPSQGADGKVVNRFGSYPGKPGNHRVLALIGKTY